ncbi:hypothetical protein [Curtobacterium citreum]|uniref:Uncharacterized protein n=1 Tax=Curtobacterium citreum TaxID=2036 RepID=A0ABU8YC14_9MICO|nr:MAG: hypothetical protein DI639_03790 [Leifsonia xyli]
MVRDDELSRQRRDRKRWMLWCAGGLVAHVVTLFVLRLWFPVSTGVVGLWVVLAVSPWFLPFDAPRAGNRPAMVGAVVVTAAGVSLLLGAAPPNTERVDAAAVGAILGVLLAVIGGAWVGFIATRFSRRQVDAEIERFRREQEAAVED